MKQLMYSFTLASRSSTLETDFYLWCYALLVVHVRNEWCMSSDFECGMLCVLYN